MHTLLAVAVLTATSCSAVSVAAQPEPAPPSRSVPSTGHAYPSANNTTIHADLYLSGVGTAPRALVLAFHMAGSDARGEYGPYTAPRLVENGYAVLTPDLRLGGARLGGVNRTITALEAAGVPELDSYCDAYPDLLATLDFAEAWLAEHYPDATGEHAIPIIALGSSYSATLVLRLASEEGDRLAGVISCSPAAGEPMEGCQPEDYLADIAIPGLVLWPERETTSEAKQRLIEAFAAHGFATHTEPGGVHGSLLLEPSRNTDNDADRAWALVLRFLEDC